MNIPTAEYGKGNVLILEDEDVCYDIELHLQSLGTKYILAMDIVRYIDTPEFKGRLKLKKTISIRTAQRWMEQTGFRWGLEKKDQYTDGHESEPVIAYRQGKFCPCWQELE